VQFLSLTLWDTYQILANLPPLPSAPVGGVGAGPSEVKRAAAEVAAELKQLGFGGNADGPDQGEVEMELQVRTNYDGRLRLPPIRVEKGRPEG
jgi:hypothetical protein